MLKSIYDNAPKKFSLSEIKVGGLVLIKLEPFTQHQIKKDPSLADLEEPDVYFAAYVVKHLSRTIRVCSAGLNDAEPFSDPYMDLPHNYQIVNLVASR